ncbi:unnamed protein product, partial [Medioppia subpectinata]
MAVVVGLLVTLTYGYDWPIVDFPCDQAEIDATKCLGAKDCLYPHPSNCNRFIQCNDAGLAYDMPCPATLHFSNSKKECDYPAVAGCDPKPKPPTTTTRKPAPG